MDGDADKRGPVLAKEDCRTADLALRVVQAADTVINMVMVSRRPFVSVV